MRIWTVWCWIAKVDGMDRKTGKSSVMGMDYGGGTVPAWTSVLAEYLTETLVDHKLSGKPYLCMFCGKPASGPYRGGKRNRCKHRIEGPRAAKARLDQHNAREVLAREFDPNRQHGIEFIDTEPYGEFE
jgi:hypothetical protein